MPNKRMGSGRRRRFRAPRPVGAAPRINPWRVVSGMLVTLLLIFLFTRLGALHKLQTFVLDSKMRLNDPPAKSEVVVVKINDEDYQKIFGGRRPLDPLALQKLIDAVALGRPKVIGVDIDTSERQFRALRIGDNWPPVVWEREPAHIAERAGEPIEQLDVLGGKDPALNASSGSPLVIADPEDRVLRRYSRFVETTDGPFPSLSWAIVSRFPNAVTRALKATREEMLINFAGDPEGSHRFTLSASAANHIASGGSLPDDNPFAGKIVLIGGAYLDEDQHQTPLGRMRGVDVLAQIIEVELAGGGDRAPNKPTIIILELFEGLMVILLFQLFHRRGFFVALIFNLLALFAISLVCSLAAYHTPARFFYFLPLLFCVLIYEFSVEYRITVVSWLWRVFGGGRGEPH